MSKKNKALKQLIRSQMQTNMQSTAQPGTIQSHITIQPQHTQQSTPTSPVTAPVMSDKQTSEFTLIKKDIRLSILLISFVIVCLLAIYLADRTNPFLLPLANKIFTLISK
jgi:hypothetical protein